MSQFTPTSCFNLKDHFISFTKEGIEILHYTTQEMAQSIPFSDGFALKVIKEDLCIGVLKFTNALKVEIDLNAEGSGVIFDNSGGTARIVTSGHLGDPVTTKHVFDLREVPIHFESHGNLLTLKCPTDGKDK